MRSRSRSWSQPPNGDRDQRSAQREDRGPRNHSPVGESSTVYVAGISRGVIADDFREPFGRFGPIREIFMKGKYAFVEYENVADATASIREMNGALVRGHKIAVEATSKFSNSNIFFYFPVFTKFFFIRIAQRRWWQAHWTPGV